MTAKAPRPPRPAFCVVEHAHQSRALAEQVSAGRFMLEVRAAGPDTCSDWIAWSASGASEELAHLEYRAAAAWVRESPAGCRSRLAAARPIDVFASAPAGAGSAQEVRP